MRQLSLLIAVAVLLVFSSGCSSSRGFTASFENDLFTGTDQAYTNGVRFGTAVPIDDPAEKAPKLLRDHFRICQTETQLNCYGSVEAGWHLSQNMYTPKDLSRTRLLRTDQPYGGWLYVGRFFDVADRDTRHHLEVSAGVVGPASIAEQTQKFIHRVFPGGAKPMGWDNQLRNEPALQSRYVFETRPSKLRVDIKDMTIVDVVPQLDLQLGNVFISGAAGASLRFGYNVTGFAPTNIGALGATPRLDRPFSLWLYGRAQERGVARNIFLDGNTFVDSHRVPRRNEVRESELGGVVRWRVWQLQYARVRRSSEFEGSTGGHNYGVLSLSRGLSF